MKRHHLPSIKEAQLYIDVCLPGEIVSSVRWDPKHPNLRVLFTYLAYEDGIYGGANADWVWQELSLNGIEEPYGNYLFVGQV